jgi:hypothetical protein
VKPVVKRQGEAERKSDSVNRFLADRQGGCGGDLRSGEPPDDAFCGRNLRR